MWLCAPLDRSSLDPHTWGIDFVRSDPPFGCSFAVQSQLYRLLLSSPTLELGVQFFFCFWAMLRSPLFGVLPLLSSDLSIEDVAAKLRSFGLLLFCPAWWGNCDLILLIFLIEITKWGSCGLLNELNFLCLRDYGSVRPLALTSLLAQSSLRLIAYLTGPALSWLLMLRSPFAPSSLSDLLISELIG